MMIVSAMTESRNPKNLVSDSERRHDKVRDWLIDVLSVATAIAAIFHYKPDGMIATLITLAGGYVVALVVWKFVWSTSGTLLGLLSALIYMATLIMALSSLPAMLISAFLPVIAQVYWIWALWPATASLSHPLTLSCAIWLVLLGIRVFEGSLFTDWRALKSS
jgi:hypothetical protein